MKLCEIQRDIADMSQRHRAPITIRRGTHERAPHHAPSGGFRNPWPSWIKPTPWQLWSGLYWGDEEAASEAPAEEGDEDGADESAKLHTPDPDYETGLAEEVDWGTPSCGDKVKVSWLGHAGILLQLPSLTDDKEPIRIIFDPIWSERCVLIGPC